MLKNADTVAKIIREISQKINPNKLEDNGLFCGNTGALLFYAYLHLHTDQDESEQLEQYFERVQNRLELNGVSDPTLSTGITGIAWTFQHLTDCGILEKDPDLFSTFDQLAVEAFKVFGSQQNYDVWHGFLGIAQYLMERHKEVDMALHLAKIPSLIWKASTTLDGEIIWIDKGRQKMFPNEEARINLGLAHGLAGILSMLARLYDLSINVAECEKLMLHVGALLLRFKSTETNKVNAYYPTVVPVSKMNAKTQFGSRLGLCHGDMGIACAFYKAGKSLQKQDWIDEAISLMDFAAKRTREGEQLDEACICHGTISAAHIFKKFYIATGKQLYADCTAHWIEATFKLKQEPTPLSAGFLYKCPVLKSGANETNWDINHSLIDGDIGLALSLLYLSDNAPAYWDKVLLLDF